MACVQNAVAGGANGMSRARSSGHAQLYMTHASERGAAARKSRRVSRIAGVEKFVVSRPHTHVQHVLSPLKSSFTLNRMPPSSYTQRSTWPDKCGLSLRGARIHVRQAPGPRYGGRDQLSIVTLMRIVQLRARLAGPAALCPGGAGVTAISRSRGIEDARMALG